MLQEPVKARVRAHLGVPVLGVQNSGISLGYRFTNQMGLLEYRMNNLQPFEEASITGNPAAATIINGNPIAGDTVTITVNALSPLTYTVTSADASAADPCGSVAQNFALKVMQTPAYAALVWATYTPSIKQPYPTAVKPNSTLILQALTSAAFTVACTFTGSTAFVAYTQGSLPSPNVTMKEDSVTLYGYVAICDYLEGKIAGASDLMKFSKADVTTFRGDEMQARRALYREWQKRLSDFLGIPLFPVPAVGRYGGSNTGLVV